MLLSFIVGLGLVYFRRRITEAVVLRVLVALLLSAPSLILYRYRRDGDIQYLLPLSYPLHAETHRFIVLIIVPPPPNIELTIYFINTPIIVLWYHTVSNAYFTSVVIFLVTDLITLVVGAFLGRLIHRGPRTFLERHKLHTEE